MQELNADTLNDFREYELEASFDANDFIDRVIGTIDVEFNKLNQTIPDDARQFFPASLGKENSNRLYNLIRHLEPATVVETGVCNGLSTAIVLKGLQDNEKGELFSVDLPRDADSGKRGAIIPLGKQSGWAVPETLRARWHLFEGNTFYKLPQIMEHLAGENRTVDIFLHDSEHSIEGMLFEYSLVWKHLREGGLLLSDNIEASAAFRIFADAQGVQKYYLSNMGLLVK